MTMRHKAAEAKKASIQLAAVPTNIKNNALKAIAVALEKKKDDIVIAMHMVFQYIYAGKVNYWLWTGGPGTWDGWEKINGEYRDVYLGIKWINNLPQFARGNISVFSGLFAIQLSPLYRDGTVVKG